MEIRTYLTCVIVTFVQGIWLMWPHRDRLQKGQWITSLALLSSSFVNTLMLYDVNHNHDSSPLYGIRIRISIFIVHKKAIFYLWDQTLRYWSRWWLKFNGLLTSMHVAWSFNQCPIYSSLDNIWRRDEAYERIICAWTKYK